MSGLMLGMIGGAIAAAATTFGALPLFSKKQWIINFLKNLNMDFIIGLMLSASAFSLILPAYQSNQNSLYITLALIVGVVFILTVSYILRNQNKALIFVIAMMVHNLPEGIASGASLAAAHSSHGYSLLSAIAIQNIPEGLTTALSFISLGLNPLWAFIANFMTGAVELFGGIIGGYLSVKIEGILPILMAFAGGSMMSLTLKEMFERIKQSRTSFLLRPGFVSGALIMLLLTKLN